MIVEMAGRPAIHLKESLEKHIKILNDVNDIKVHSIKISEPREIPAEEGKNVPKEEVMFTAFAEADFETIQGLADKLKDTLEVQVKKFHEKHQQ